MEVQRVLIDQGGMALVRCPTCQREEVFSALRLRGKHRVKLKCRCESVFEVEMEFRQKHRKETDLDGLLSKCMQEGKWGKLIWESSESNLRPANCKIRNISVLGVGLVLSRKLKIKPGDRIRLEFRLDTPKSPEIRKEALVRHANGNYLGCEFLNGEKQDRTLGFYVL